MRFSIQNIVYPALVTFATCIFQIATTNVAIGSSYEEQNSGIIIHAYIDDVRSGFNMIPAVFLDPMYGAEIEVSNIVYNNAMGSLSSYELAVSWKNGPRYTTKMIFGIPRSGQEVDRTVISRAFSKDGRHDENANMTSFDKARCAVYIVPPPFGDSYDSKKPVVKNETAKLEWEGEVGSEKLVLHCLKAERRYLVSYEEVNRPYYPAPTGNPKPKEDHRIRASFRVIQE